ncbi:MAG TPA: hypothetical protein VFP09_10000 [Desertimonas sp.]|nr:hypothetical protein [Desertimonas sp.]
MSMSEIQQLRITTTFEADRTRLLPEPRIIKAEHVASDDARLVGRGSTFSTTLADDSIVRELREADLQTADGVARLLTSIGLDRGPPVDMASLGIVDQQSAHEAPDAASPLIIEGLYVEPRGLVGTASHGSDPGVFAGTVRTTDDSFVFDAEISCGHWRHAAQRLRLVRAAVNHYVAHREGTDLLAAWKAEGFEPEVDHGFLDAETFGDDANLAALGRSREADAWRVFVNLHAHLMRDHLPGLAVLLTHGRASLRVSTLPGSISTALMVQLHNVIVDGIEIRRCANETCQRPFTRQRGRALKGQYRSTGVMYCDAACAKAQMQREYRRRNRRVADHQPSPAERTAGT